MADKKPAAKPAPKAGLGDALEGQIVLFLFLFILVLLVVAPTVLRFFGFNGGLLGFIPDNILESAAATFSAVVDTVGFISIFISLVLLMALTYAKVRYKEVVGDFEKQQKALENIGKPKLEKAPVGAGQGVSAGNGAVVGGVVLPGSEESDVQGSAALQPTNPKWLDVERKMASGNPAEWRVAILEADIMLYEMLERMGYEGDSIGEILKKVEPSDFATVQDAWKAHIIRNRIAHEAGYELTREEADRAIRLFKRVFDEFYFI